MRVNPLPTAFESRVLLRMASPTSPQECNQHIPLAPVDFRVLARGVAHQPSVQAKLSLAVPDVQVEIPDKDDVCIGVVGPDAHKAVSECL